MHLYRIREITARVARAIVEEAVKEDNAEGYRDTDVKQLQQLVKDKVSLVHLLIPHHLMSLSGTLICEIWKKPH